MLLCVCVCENWVISVDILYANSIYNNERMCDQKRHVYIQGVEIEFVSIYYTASKSLSAPVFVWCKTTLNTGSVGRAGEDPYKNFLEAAYVIKRGQVLIPHPVMLYIVYTL